jgi:hypothetical protein
VGGERPGAEDGVDGHASSGPSKGKVAALAVFLAFVLTLVFFLISIVLVFILLFFVLVLAFASSSSFALDSLASRFSLSLFALSLLALPCLFARGRCRGWGRSWGWGIHVCGGDPPPSLSLLPLPQPQSSLISRRHRKGGEPPRHRPSEAKSEEIKDDEAPARPSHQHSLACPRPV